MPRVPVADDSMQGEMPTYRDIWLRIRDHLPKKGRGTKDESATGDPKPLKELEGALLSLYGNYEKYYRQWEQNTEARASGATPPVFIVVCNNTNVSKLIYDWISGYEKTLPDGNSVVVPGNLGIFSNGDSYGQWLPIPNTILIDSAQLESGEAMSKEFKKMAEVAIEEFKSDYRKRFPGRGTEKLTDEDLLREVMNTVGKAGKLGENVRCVVSVSMLTEGWDAQTVTHIMGVRAFGTQLLCEPVVGRALRRRSYEPGDNGMFDTEYAEVYGVPFSFIPCSGTDNDIKPPRPITRVRALDDRIACEITFPRIIGYKYDLPPEKLEAVFTEDSLPFNVLVAISDTAIIHRSSQSHFDNVCKADLIPDKIDEIIKDYQKEKGFLSLSFRPFILSDNTREEICRFLIKSHSPLVSQILRTTAPVPLAQLKKQPHKHVYFHCSKCSSTKLNILWGKYGYYFKCNDCKENTPIKQICPKCNIKMKLRKEKSRFYTECTSCGETNLFYTNPN